MRESPVVALARERAGAGGPAPRHTAPRHTAPRHTARPRSRRSADRDRGYDGPLIEIARVDFDDRDPLVEISTSLVCRVTGEPPRQTVVLRLSREHIVKMLDLVDGKPVEDHDEAIHQAADPAGGPSSSTEDAPTPI